MTTDVSAHGPGVLLSMMQMPGLGSPAAADMSLMLSSAAVAAEGYGEPGPGPSSSGTGDSHADAVQADAAAAQFLGSQAALSLASQEAALSQLKKACKAAKGAPRKRPGHKKQQLVCKVDGCGAQLATAKAYYQRHKVCAVHLSSMCAHVNGVASRFCQQCGKFQPLEEFDADKRSCRARLKRHNNRRREQRHNKSYEFALGLRCQAAVQLLGAMAEQEEEGGFDPFYTQPGLAAAFQPARFTAHYQPHQFGLAAGFTPAELPPELANVASAALPAEQLQFQQGPLSDFEQQQQHFQHGGPQDYEQQQQQQQQHFQPAQALGGLLDRWPQFDCPAPAGSSPQQSPHDVSGGQQSEGTTATMGQHGSLHASPSIALVAAVASGTAAAAAAAGGGVAVGTPTSRRGGLRRVSANRALEALRVLNSTHSTESEWDDESEDGSRSPAPWQQQQQQRRGATRLQAGSRLRAAGGSISTSGAAGPYDLPQDFAPHVGHLMPQQQQQQQLFKGLQGTQGFNADLSNLHPGSSMQQQQPDQWGGADYSTGDVQAGWEASLAAHLQDQQQQQPTQHQQQHWGSAYDGSCGGAGTALTGSGGGVSYDQTYVSGPPMPAHLSSAGGCVSGPMQQAAGLGVQHSAPAGLCYHSRSNSPVVSTGGFPAAAAAAAAGGGPGPSLLGPAGMRGAAAASQGLAGGPCLSHQWSLPAHQQDFYGAPAGSGEGGGPMQQLQDELAQARHGAAAAAAAAGGPLLPLGAMQQVCQGAEGAAFGSMQPHELQQALQGLLPPGMGGHSPPEVPMGDSGSTAVAGFPEEGNNPVCGLAVVAAASQGLPAGQHMHGLQHCSTTQPEDLMGSSMQQQAPADGMFGSSGGCAEGMASLAGGMLAAGSQGMSLSTDQADRRNLSPQTSMTAAAAAAAAAIVRGGFVAAVARQRGQYSDSAVDCSLHPMLAEQDNNPAATTAAALLPHCEQQPVQQQQHLAHDLQPCSINEQQQPGNSFAAATGGYVSSSPDSSSAGHAGGMGPAAVCAGMQHLRTDSQGTSVLREELAGVSLGSDHTWQQQMLATADMHMADAPVPHAQLQGMQLDAHGTPGMQSGSPPGVEDGGFGMQMQLMAAASAGCAEQGAAVQEQSPGTEFDSADTAAAAATFEAQLAACCGNKDSQEAVFKAWLDALLPNGEQQRQQQQHHSQALQQQQQPLSASMSPADPGPAYYDLQQRQQHLGTDADAHASLGLAAAAGGADVGAGTAAAAVPHHLAAQRAALVVQEAGGDGLNPEDDFRELLDLLLDA